MITDTALYTIVMDKLDYEPTINPEHITVSVKEGIVTLSGKVRSLSEKRSAERAVNSIQGVRAVANDIGVNILDTYQRMDRDIAKAAVYALEWNFNVPTNKVKVVVDNGVVKLSGEVEWWHQRNAAEKAVRNLIGVTGVLNEINIQPRAGISAEEIKKKITDEFKRSAEIDAKNVQVEIKENKVNLKGHVSSWAEMKEATRAVWSVPGVTEINNQLQIEP